MILINISICLDNNANSLFVKQGVKGWPVPTLKQLFSMKVIFKNKFKKRVTIFLGKLSSKQGDIRSSTMSLTTLILCQIILKYMI